MPLLERAAGRLIAEAPDRPRGSSAGSVTLTMIVLRGSKSVCQTRWTVSSL